MPAIYNPLQMSMNDYLVEETLQLKWVLNKSAGGLD